MKSQIEGELTIGTLAALTGCKPETIRYYEQVGVLSKPARTEDGQRRYAREHHQRLNFVRRARDLGFPLEEGRGLLRLVDEPGHTCAEVEKVARKHLDGVQSRLADLRALEGVLMQIVAQCGGGSVPQCPVIEALNRDGDDLQGAPDNG